MQVLFLDVCFRKQENKHCTDGQYGPIFSSLSHAIDACASDIQCEKVYDFKCDQAGQFYLCHWNTTEYFSNQLNGTTTQPSCLYIKETENGNCG